MIVPSGVIRPIALPPASVNHRLPSGPGARSGGSPLPAGKTLVAYGAAAS